MISEMNESIHAMDWRVEKLMTRGVACVDGWMDGWID